MSLKQTKIYFSYRWMVAKGGKSNEPEEWWCPVQECQVRPGLLAKGQALEWWVSIDLKLSFHNWTYVTVRMSHKTLQIVFVALHIKIRNAFKILLQRTTVKAVVSPSPFAHNPSFIRLHQELPWFDNLSYSPFNKVILKKLVKIL